MTETPTEPTAPTGLKAKANEVGLKVYVASPPKAQTAMLNGFVKAQQVLSKAAPYKTKIVAGTGAALVLRRLKRRKGRS